VASLNFWELDFLEELDDHDYAWPLPW